MPKGGSLAATRRRTQRRTRRHPSNINLRANAYRLKQGNQAVRRSVKVRLPSRRIVRAHYAALRAPSVERPTLTLEELNQLAEQNRGGLTEEEYANLQAQLKENEKANRKAAKAAARASRKQLNALASNLQTISLNQ